MQRMPPGCKWSWWTLSVRRIPVEAKGSACHGAIWCAWWTLRVAVRAVDAVRVFHVAHVVDKDADAA